jgi:lipopolysaccharide/colanic/teichoic acid biosynthesis glycosyltransferase
LTSAVAEQAHGDVQLASTSLELVENRVGAAVPAHPVVYRQAVRQRSRRERLDAYFRRGDTPVARVIRKFSSATGTDYTRSVTKRILDVTLSLPLSLIAIPIILVLIGVNKLLHPGHPALFLQDRAAGGGRRLRVIKIRSMLPGSDETPAQAVCTAFGRRMRRHYLDEFPQLLQVLSGRLTVVGIRVLPENVYGGLATSWSPPRFEAWSAMYGATRLGLTGVHQVFRGVGKEDIRRFHRDMFYARHASLGFDLYLLWRTLGTTAKEVHPRRREAGVYMMAGSAPRRLY